MMLSLAGLPNWGAGEVVPGPFTLDARGALWCFLLSGCAGKTAPMGVTGGSGLSLFSP